MSDEWEATFHQPSPTTIFKVSDTWFCDMCGAMVYGTEKTIHNGYHQEIRELLRMALLGKE